MMINLFLPFLALCAPSLSLAFHTPSTTWRAVSLMQGNEHSVAKRWNKSNLQQMTTLLQPTTRGASSRLLASDSDSDAASFTSAPRDDMIIDASSILQRISWLSWWSQAILSVVSSVTLLFARNVVRASSGSNGGEGLLIAGSGLIVSFVSIFWTWGGVRLGKRLVRKDMARISAANMIRRCISVGITVNILGMALALVGAEQIVGSLAIKVLTQQGVLGGYGDRGAALQSLQPLDILVVQGNTNTLLSHFCSLVAFLYLTKLVKRLDPPSIDGDERKRSSKTS